MENPMILNAYTYAWASSTSESDITLTERDKTKSRVIITNVTQYPVAVTSGVSAATAAFPTSATVPVDVTVVPAGATMTYSKLTTHGIISLIQSTQDSGAYVYVTVGTGE